MTVAIKAGRCAARAKSSTENLVGTEPSSLELTEELIRKRAYYFYEQRGRKIGHDLEDWFRAEAEIIGRKTRGSGAAQKETRWAGA